MSRTYRLEHDHGLSLDEVKAIVGGKAANLGVMVRELGLPVPPGFAITTATCREFLAGDWPSGLDAELRDRMRELEGAVGRRFGDPADPLLVSVRSGAPVSMPGMMDTVLDLGLNDATAAGLARVAGEGFAQECRERFETSFRSIVGVAEAPDDPWTQLRLAIEAVFRSWNSDRAVAYRRREGIADDLGTAVTIQAMVFGNRGPTSATGVAFTRNPATGEPTLFGDVLFDAQGEDVVAGTHATEPLTVLDERLPDVAGQLREYAMRLERHYADLCDIEFTIEEGRLWMLQVRIGKRSPQAALRVAVDMAQDPEFPLSREEAVRRVLPLLADPPKTTVSGADRPAPILVGLAASPGLATGPIALTSASAIAAAESGTPPILVRAETSPNDVPGMAKSAGILTSKGGLASHAAVVARGWGIPAVVGAEGLTVSGEEIAIGDRRLQAGEVISIDGSTGEVFEGAVGGSTEVVPEAAVLRSWAEEVGIAIDEHDAAAPEPAASNVHVSADACIRTIGIKGFATLEGLSDALLAAGEAIQPIVDAFVAKGLATTTAGAFTLTDAGKARSADLVAAERDDWRSEAASAALDGFLELDHRMKDIVTAWQMRNPQALNDHSDADYDRGVLDRLRKLHSTARAWLTPLEAAAPRLAIYRLRLDRAIERVDTGDTKYVASPRVDSYHSVWFELHEDLIQLAGRTREAEVAAGRA